jgi:hypothetical protein
MDYENVEFGWMPPAYMTILALISYMKILIEWKYPFILTDTTFKVCHQWEHSFEPQDDTSG